MMAIVKRNSGEANRIKSFSLSPRYLIRPILVRHSIRTNSAAKNNNVDHSTMLRYLLNTFNLSEKKTAAEQSDPGVGQLMRIWHRFKQEQSDNEGQYEKAFDQKTFVTNGILKI